MTSPFVAEVRIFPFNYAPSGWATCDGQLMSIAQNTALFSLLGTTYGGDGRTSFALPNFQASAAIGQGSGPGLSTRNLGYNGGEPGVTLTTAQMPIHTHTLSARGVNATVNTAGPSAAIAKPPASDQAFAPGAGGVSMSPQAISASGSSLPHNNMQPYLTLLFCIALQGVYPPRS